MTMTHPGLPNAWGVLICTFMLLLGLWAVLAPPPKRMEAHGFNLNKAPFLGAFIRFFTATPWPLLTLKILMAAIFLLILVAGLWGTPIPERNIATVFTWNLWWAGVIVSVFFLGSFWCSICPWDALATWMVRRRLWRRGGPNNSLNLSMPKWFRNLMPALFMLIGLTWLELGLGITISPYETALMALLMLVLCIVSMAFFERKAFCRYFCPVGRIIGFYSQLAPVELRPVDQGICSKCVTLECYHGNDLIEPCPTNLTMGRLTQNTYCLSCCNCIQSCPDKNVSWRLRPQSVEAIQSARPHWDESWFIIALLGLTTFHGISMMPFWEEGLRGMGQMTGDSTRLLGSFSAGLAGVMILTVLLYFIMTAFTHRLCGADRPFSHTFTSLAFVALPLAFAYHLAHNLNHLFREVSGYGDLILNPMGIGTQPLSMMEKHVRAMTMLLPQDAVFALQAGLMMFGFWIAIKVIRHRGHGLFPNAGWRLFPMIVFAAGVTGCNLLLMMQPMIMRM